LKEKVQKKMKNDGSIQNSVFQEHAHHPIAKNEEKVNKYRKMFIKRAQLKAGLASGFEKTRKGSYQESSS
jgi:hypothetical protein